MDKTVPWIVNKDMYNTQESATGPGKMFWTFQRGLYNDIASVLINMLGITDPLLSPRPGAEIEKFRSTMVAQNNTNFIQRVTLYYCKPRQDSFNVLPTSCLNTGIDSAHLNIATCQGVAASAKNFPINMTPFDVPFFTQRYKVYKTKTIVVPAGGSFFVNLKARNIEGRVHNTGNLLSTGAQGTDSSTKQVIKKFTNFVMICSQSTLAHTIDAPQVIQRPRGTWDIQYSNIVKARIITSSISKNTLTYSDNGANTTSLHNTNITNGAFVVPGGAI